jgi:carbamoyl-phosphate synthase large subunit
MGKILISAACGPMFPQISTPLRVLYAHDLVLIDSSWIADYMRYVQRVRWVGEGYFDDVTAIIERERPEYYVPLIDEELHFSHTTGLRVIAPTDEFISACLDKESLMQYLRDLRLSYVRVEHGNAFKGPYPAFIKPNVGRGSRGARIVHSEKEMEAHCLLSGYKAKDLIVQELLEGAEYTVSVTVNNRNQILSIVPKRVIEKRGVTLHAVTEESEPISRLCQDIVRLMRPGGPFNVQLIMVGDEPKVFEINPRLSTTTVLTQAAGVCEIQKCIEYWDVDSVPYFPFEVGKRMFRRWENGVV